MRLNEIKRGCNVMQFEDIIRKTIEERCEDYFLGIADLSLAEEAVIQQYGSLFYGYPRAISIGITLPYIIQMNYQKTMQFMMELISS